MLSRSPITVEVKSSMDKKCKAMAERRRVLEQARSVNVRRIQQEVQRIAQREVEYAQRLISEYAPVKLSFNESVWNRWQEFLPIRVEFVEKDEKKVESVTPSVVKSNEAESSTEDFMDNAPSSENP